MDFIPIEPHTLLKPYIEKMWVFKSSGKLPSDDFKLVVPNGNMKMTFTSVNGITATVGKNEITSKEGIITLTGVIDIPVSIDTQKDLFTETIGIEFNPKGAFRFFRLNFGEIRNNIIELNDILGSSINQLENEAANAETLTEKIKILQQFLIKELMQNTSDPVYEFCIDKIISTKGKVSVKELEKKTGYSSRWLNMKFSENLGVSPKNLSSIIRFKECYEAFNSAILNNTVNNSYYEFYHDQSHFIKNFKHYTGLLPSGLDPNSNDFGRKYYKA